MGLVEARSILERRLREREADFLTLMQRAVYAQRASPYLQLLRLAGCECGDLERLVHRAGLEDALASLFRQGVYLSVDEFKGRQPARRGNASVEIDPVRLRNPSSSIHLMWRTGASRGRGTPVPFDLAYLHDRAIDNVVTLEALEAFSWQHGLWRIPGGTAMFQILYWTASGAPPERWFSPVDPSTPGLHSRYRWSERALRWVSRLSGIRAPAPEYASVDDPELILRWLSEVLERGGTPHLLTTSTSAVRLCQAAAAAGVDIRGAWFTVGGEPTTEMRRKAFERTGTNAIPLYSSMEAGTVGYGCLKPSAPDELHQLSDLVALVQPGAAGPAVGLPSRALLVTSLRPSAAFVLLNVSLGDEADLSERSCGCPLQRYGWKNHLQYVRSFEKLTAGGVTFLDLDVVRVLEEVLPGRFGGGPTDYQLVEEEGEDGQPRLRLLVHPAAGPVDPTAVAETFLAAVGAGSGAERLMELHWRQAGVLRVERRPPLATGGGKVLHLYRERRSAPSA